MDSIIENFFETLSYRINNENALSDITYAMCLSSVNFSRFFLNFLFPEYHLNGGGSWEREFAEVEGSRPDFKYVESNQCYIVENKIYDSNTHNEQYAKDFPKYKKAFIANYEPLPELVNLYDSHKTWTEFCSALMKNYLSTVTEEEQSLTKGYLRYIKNVISFWEVKTMNFNSISSIKSFFVTINSIAEKHNLTCYHNKNILDSCVLDWLGKWYHDSSNCYYYFCLPLNKETSTIEIWFLPANHDKSSLKNLKEKIDSSNIPLANLYDYVDTDYGLGFSLNEEIMKKYFLSSGVSLEDQQSKLNEFFEQVEKAVSF